MDAAAYALRLLADLGVDAARLPRGAVAPHPARRWSASGAMTLTGHRDGPPLMCPVPLAACADGALLALHSIADAADGMLPPGAELLSERAALAGLAQWPHCTRRRVPPA
jgi:hypothetical protein